MKSSGKPSPRQLAILKYIRQYNLKNNRPPVYREIEKAIGVKSTSVVTYHVRKLEAKDLLSREKNVSRGLKLTDKGQKILPPLPRPVRETAGVVRLPIIGDIAAGEPVTPGNGDFPTYDPEEDAIAVDENQLPSRKENVFALRVRGDSMIDALVQDGDIVILEKGAQVRNGDMVAAWIPLDEEMTLKYYYREGDNVRLQPANPYFDPIRLPAANVQVQGKLLSVIRHTAA